MQALSPECTPASSTCSMMPPMIDSPVRVSDRVDIDFDRVFEEAVHQEPDVQRTSPPSRPSEPIAGHLGHGVAQAFFVVHDSHRSTAEHIRRAHESRVTNLVHDLAIASSTVVQVPPGGCGMFSRSHSAFQRSRSSARSIDSGLVPAISPRQGESHLRA